MLSRPRKASQYFVRNETRNSVGRNRVRNETELLRRSIRRGYPKKGYYAVKCPNLTRIFRFSADFNGIDNLTISSALDGSILIWPLNPAKWAFKDIKGRHRCTFIIMLKIPRRLILYSTEFEQLGYLLWRHGVPGTPKSVVVKNQVSVSMHDIICVGF